MAAGWLPNMFPLWTTGTRGKKKEIVQRDERDMQERPLLRGISCFPSFYRNTCTQSSSPQERGQAVAAHGPSETCQYPPATSSSGCRPPRSATVAPLMFNRVKPCSANNDCILGEEGGQIGRGILAAVAPPPLAFRPPWTLCCPLHCCWRPWSLPFNRSSNRRR